MEPVSHAIGTIASGGVLGAIVVIMLWAYWKKDKEFSDYRKDKDKELAEYRSKKEEELADHHEKNAGLLLTLQREVIGACHKLAEVVEIVERQRDEDRTSRRIPR